MGKKQIRLCRSIGATIAILALSGCAQMQMARNSALDEKLVAGDYRGAALIAEDRLGYSAAEDGSLPPVQFQRANVLDHLEAGKAWQLAGDPVRAALHFDAVEEALKDVETQGMVAAGGKQVAAVLTNDTMLDYMPSPAEAVLVNYYKTLAFLETGRRDDARVELNRAEDRIRRAVERYESEINAATAKAGSDPGYSDPKVKSGIDANFPEMAQWQPYQDFVVPPATYLHALFLGRSRDSGDQATSAQLYGRLVGIVDSNPAVLQDAAEASSGRVCPANDCVWVMVEHGMGPELVEKRFDLSVFTLNGLLTVSMALPSLQSRTDSDVPPIRVVDGGMPVDVARMASMDRVVQTEFTKRFPAVVTRAVASATVKAVAQKQVNDQNPMLGLLANVGSMLMTGADVRMWRSMPGRFSLARIRRTAMTDLTLETAAGPVKVALPATGSALVHVSVVSQSAGPKVEVVEL